MSIIARFLKNLAISCGAVAGVVALIAGLSWVAEHANSYVIASSILFLIAVFLAAVFTDLANK